MLAAAIERELASSPATDSLSEEVAAHSGFGHSRGDRRFFVGRTEALSAVATYLRGNDTHPLVLAGAAGTGKTALIARVADDLGEAGGPAQLAVRYVGATAASDDVRTLVTEIGQEIARGLSTGSGIRPDRSARF